MARSARNCSCRLPQTGLAIFNPSAAVEPHRCKCGFAILLPQLALAAITGNLGAFSVIQKPMRSTVRRCVIANMAGDETEQLAKIKFKLFGKEN